MANLSDDALCSICLEHMYENTHITSCNHKFHIECLKMIRKSKEYSVIKSKIPSNIPERHLYQVEFVVCVLLFPDLFISSFVGLDNYEKYKHYAKPPRTPELVLSLLNLVKDSVNHKL